MFSLRCGGFSVAAIVAVMAVAGGIYSVVMPPDVDVLPASYAEGKDHLVVLAHGLLGTPGSMHTVAEVFRKHSPHLFVHKAQANFIGPRSYFGTTDGVQAGGARLAEEVLALKEAHPGLTSISFVGLSLGGLYIREAARILHEKATFEHHRNFITLASPHTGVRGHLSPFHHVLIRLGLAGETGREMILEDDDSLILSLASPAHLEALAKFEHRVAYANLKHDNRIPFRSAALLGHDEELFDPSGSHAPLYNASAVDIPPHFRTQYPYVRSIFKRHYVAQPPPHPSVVSELTHGKARSGTAGAPVVHLDTEAILSRRISSVGNWSVVVVDFPEDVLAPFLNHQRIAGLPPLGVLGESVVEHMVQEMFHSAPVSPSTSESK